ncbi:hypothetical protein J6590_091474 [Homalodisca vitripennis]|nr:hypothetical protein J6590_091474 [Homalodisca vitripennis]
MARFTIEMARKGGSQTNLPLTVINTQYTDRSSRAHGQVRADPVLIEPLCPALYIDSIITTSHNKFPPTGRSHLEYAGNQESEVRFPCSRQFSPPIVPANSWAPPSWILSTNQNAVLKGREFYCCGFEVSERNDSKLPSNNSEVNTRLVYAFRSIGKGEETAKHFCAVVNLRNPPAFKYYNKLLCNIAKEVCSDTMKEAVEETVEAMMVTVKFLQLSMARGKGEATSLNGQYLQLV